MTAQAWTPPAPPRTKPHARTVVVLLAVLIAVFANPLLELVGSGMSASNFERDGDTTLRAAGWAFAIWGVIYLALIAYGIWQILPATRESPELKAAAWPSVFANLGCAAWLVAAGEDAKLATVVIIALSAAAAVWAVLAARRARGELWPEGHRLLFWPLGLLAGWLTIATALNLLTVLTAWGAIAPEAAQMWALGGIAAVLLVGGLVLARLRHAAYGLPIAWGLIGVWAAERGDQPTVAWVALGASVLVLAASLAAGRRA